MFRILVTGATGFIGRHLCPLLCGRGYTVRAALRRTAPVTLPGGIELITVGEIGPNTDWTGALKDVDCVVHLAALAHQIAKTVPWVDYETTNVRGTEALAEAVRVSTVQRFIFVSSIGAVCTLSNEIVTQSTPCRPESDYGKSKRIAEIRVQEILEDGAVDYCIIRPSLVYGVGNPGNMLRLFQLIETGLPLPLASIRNQRSFIYVENLADVIEKSVAHAGPIRKIFNVSDGQIFSTPELIKIIARAMKRDARLVPFPVGLLSLCGTLIGRKPEITRLCGSLAVDVVEVTRELRWSPPVTMEEGLARTLDWYHRTDGSDR